MNLRRLLLIGLVAVLSAGCAEQQQPNLHEFVAEVRSRPSPPIEPLPEMQPYIPYSYEARGRRAPFTPMPEPRKPQQDNSNGNELHPNLDRNPDPLEAFPLDSLTMVGTITVDGVRYALIHAPDGRVYRATVGDHAGQNYGRIVAIKKKVVLLTEIIPDGMGGYMKSPARIPLAQ